MEARSIRSIGVVGVVCGCALGGIVSFLETRPVSIYLVLNTQQFR